MEVSPYILNIGFVSDEKEDLIATILDAQNIFVSTGSACSSGVNTRSRVIKELREDDKFRSLRVSFSVNNTVEEVDIAIQTIIDSI